MSIESVMPSSHLILCRPLLLLPSIFPSIRVFTHESVLCIRWPKYWSFGFSISPSNEYSGLISFRMDWLGRKMRSTQTLTRITVPINFQFWNYLPCCVQLYTHYWLNGLGLLFMSFAAQSIPTKRIVFLNKSDLEQHFDLTNITSIAYTHCKWSTNLGR